MSLTFFRRIVAAAVLATLLSACASKPTGVIPRPEGDARLAVTVVPVRPLNIVDANFTASSFFGTAGAITSGIPGLVVGSGIDALVTLVRYSREERFLQALDRTFEGVDVERHFLGMLEPLPELPFADFRMAESSERGRMQWNIARDVMLRSKADAVVVMDAAYRMSPNKDRFVVTLLQYSYRRRNESSRMEAKPTIRHAIRRYTYMSPARPIVPRLLTEAERTKMKADIQARYEREAGDAEDREALAKARDAAFEELDALEDAPLDLLFSETWTPALVREYLAEASEHLGMMLQLDWEALDAPIDMDASRLVTVMTGNSPPQRVRAVRVAETPTHLIMRSAQFGNLYAVPKQ